MEIGEIMSLQKSLRKIFFSKSRASTKNVLKPAGNAARSSENVCFLFFWGKEILVIFHRDIVL